MSAVLSLEEWRELARPFFDVVSAGGPKAFRARGTFAQHGRLISSDVRFGSALFAHDPKLLKAYDNEYLLFERYTEGTARGLVGEISARIDPKTIHVMDMSRRVQTATTNAVVRGVVIPHHVIGYDPSRDAPYVALPLASPRGRLLDLALQMMLAPSLPVTDAEAVSLADAFVGLVRHLMLNQPDPDAGNPMAQAGRLRVEDYINRALGNPDLSVARLCRIFGLSRATLYRMFADEGGVQRYIDARRLDRCFAELHHAPATYGRIRDVAGRWGFHEAADFNRRFKSRFGIRPSDCLVTPQAATRDASPRVILPPVQAWMGKL